MSKKPSQSRHRIPAFVLDNAMQCDPIDDRYQAEIDASMAKLERQFAKAQKAHEAALAKQERLRERTEALAAKKAEQELVAAHRADEESKLTDRIALIKQAAQSARVKSARADQERRHAEAIAQRNAQTAQRKAAIVAARDHERQLVAVRAQLRNAEADTAERYREFKEIERLMMPGNYAGQAHRATGVSHWAGAR